MDSDAIQVVRIFTHMMSVISWIAVAYVVLAVAALFLEQWPYHRTETRTILRISPGWHGVRIFKTTPRIHAQLWIPWRDLWPAAKLTLMVWRSHKSPENK